MGDQRHTEPRSLIDMINPLHSQVGDDPQIGDLAWDSGSTAVAVSVIPCCSRTSRQFRPARLPSAWEALISRDTAPLWILDGQVGPRATRLFECQGGQGRRVAIPRRLRFP